MSILVSAVSGNKVVVAEAGTDESVRVAEAVSWLLGSEAEAVVDPPEAFDEAASLLAFESRSFSMMTSLLYRNPSSQATIGLVSFCWLR